MTWTRVRTWIGDNPMRATNAAMVLSCLATVPLAVAGNLLIGRPRIDEWVIIVGLPPVLMPLVALGAGYAGVLLGRSGQSVHRVLWSLLWAPWLAACGAVLETVGELLAAIPSGISAYHQEFARPHYAREIWFGLFGAFTAGILLGWAAAAIVTRHMISRGKWEVTGPSPAPPWDTPPPEARP